MNIASNAIIQSQSPYSTERTFTAAKYEETIWDHLLPQEAESYRYYLAFELSRVEGFKVGYVAVRRGGIVVCLAPYFLMNFHINAAMGGPVQPMKNCLYANFPELSTIRLVCVGSPVSDNCKIGITPDFLFDPEMISALNEQLRQIAKIEEAQAIVFKDLLHTNMPKVGTALIDIGYNSVESAALAAVKIDFKTIDEYLNRLSLAEQSDIREKINQRSEIQIEEYNGAPPDFEAIHQLYLNSYETSSLNFEKLTLNYFESLSGLMPNNCRYVLYKHHGKLIGFNMLIQRGGRLIHKYFGFDNDLSEQYHLDCLSWLYNIEMCIRDGFEMYQSGRASDENKIKVCTTLEQTYLYFQSLYSRSIK